MTKTLLTGIFLACSMLVVTPALAITVTNQDKKEQTFTIDQGETQADQKIAAGASAEVECKGGCEVRVRGSGYGRSARTGDKLVIDDQGMVHFAGEDIVTGSIKASDSDKSAN